MKVQVYDSFFFFAPSGWFNLAVPTAVFAVFFVAFGVKAAGCLTSPMWWGRVRALVEHVCLARVCAYSCKQAIDLAV